VRAFAERCGVDAKSVPRFAVRNGAYDPRLWMEELNDALEGGEHTEDLRCHVYSFGSLADSVAWVEDEGM